MADRSKHKVTIQDEPNTSATYKFLATCTCGWNGRSFTKEEAKTLAEQHVAFHKFRRNF